MEERSMKCSVCDVENSCITLEENNGRFCLVCGYTTNELLNTSQTISNKIIEKLPQAYQDKLLHFDSEGYIWHPCMLTGLPDGRGALFMELQEIVNDGDVNEYPFWVYLPPMNVPKKDIPKLGKFKVNIDKKTIYPPFEFITAYEEYKTNVLK